MHHGTNMLITLHTCVDIYFKVITFDIRIVFDAYILLLLFDDS